MPMSDLFGVDGAARGSITARFDQSYFLPAVY